MNLFTSIVSGKRLSHITLTWYWRLVVVNDLLVSVAWCCKMRDFPPFVRYYCASRTVCGPCVACITQSGICHVEDWWRAQLASTGRLSLDKCPSVAIDLLAKYNNALNTRPWMYETGFICTLWYRPFTTDRRTVGHDTFSTHTITIYGQIIFVRPFTVSYMHPRVTHRRSI